MQNYFGCPFLFIFISFYIIGFPLCFLINLIKGEPLDCDGDGELFEDFYEMRSGTFADICG